MTECKLLSVIAFLLFVAVVLVLLFYKEPAELSEKQKLDLINEERRNNPKWWHDYDGRK